MARGNFTTGSQRYNARMDKIMDRVKEIKRQENLLTSYKSLVSAGYSKETAKHIMIERKLKRMSGL